MAVHDPKATWAAEQELFYSGLIFGCGIACSSCRVDRQGTRRNRAASLQIA
jgi:hypothetical protein